MIANAVGRAEHRIVKTSDLLAGRRKALGLSQAELAHAVGVDEAEVRRYESGEQQPVLSVAAALAAVLRIGLEELAGFPTQWINLAGEWWASWQAHQDGEEIITSQELILRQQGNHIDFNTAVQGLIADNGGFQWHGELRLWHNEILTGWYAANDGSARSTGAMYFVIQPLGRAMTGKWVGIGSKGQIVVGWATMARTVDEGR